MPHVNSSFSEPVHHASYDNAIKLHDEFASSSQACHNRPAGDDQAVYDVIDDLLPGQNHNYDYVLPRQNKDIEKSEISSTSTEPVYYASCNNNQLASSKQTSGHNNQRPASGDQAAYEVPVEISSSGQKDDYDDTIPRDEHYEKNTNETHYQPLEFSRQTLYQELYEKVTYV